jgi:ferredoxin
MEEIYSREFIDSTDPNGKKKVTITDLGNGKIVKTNQDGEVIGEYDIMVGAQIPQGQTIIDYSYFQKEETIIGDENESLISALARAGIPAKSYCSSTCVAMAIAISQGDSSITPIDAIYLGDNNTELNWSSKGLNSWEIDNVNDYLYDNRINSSYVYGGDIKINTYDQYLNTIKQMLINGVPCIIHVDGPRTDGHFVVVVGVSSDVSIYEADFNDLVIFDTATSKDKRIATIKDSFGEYTPYNINDNGEFRIISPHIIDEEGSKNTGIITVDRIIDSYKQICARIEEIGDPQTTAEIEEIKGRNAL